MTLDQQARAVNNTCKTGTVWDYSQATPMNTGTPVNDYADLGATTILPTTSR